MKKKDYKNILMLISVGLIIIAAIFLLGNVFGANMDWINQHTVIPEYFRQYFYDTKKLLPDIIYNLGLGENAFNFSYYGLLNPVILISYFFPFIKMTNYIIISSIILYFISVYLFYKFLRPKFDSKYTTLLTFIFMCSSPILFHFHRQIMFVNYMPFLLMALINIDKFENRNSKIFLILNVFFLILSSYYFSIGSILVILIYYMYLNFDKPLKEKLKIFVPIIISILMSGVLLIPSLSAILSNRTSSSESVNLLGLLLPNFNYSKILYGSYALGLFSSSIISVVYLLLKKEKSFKFLSTVILVIFSFPIFRYLLNGGLYVRSKTLIPFIPLVVLVFGIFLRDLFDRKIEMKKIFFVILAFVILGLFDFNLAYYLDLLATTTVFGLYYKFKNKYIIVVPLIVLSFVLLITSNFNEQYITIAEYKNLETNYDQINKIIESDDAFYRIAELDNTLYNVNRSFSNKHYKTSAYSSVINKYYKSFYYDILNINNNNYNNLILRDTDNIIFNGLTNVKYLISPQELGYGYSQMGENTYINNYALSLGYASSNVYSLDNFTKLEYPHNLKYLLNGVVADVSNNNDTNDIIEKYNFDLLASLEERIPFKKQNNSYYLNLTEEKSFNIKLDKLLNNKLLFITITGLESNSCDNEDISIIINNQENSLSCSSWLYHNQNYTFNYLINQRDLEELNITMKPGIYKIDSINLYTMDIDFLNNNFDQMVNISINNNEISGNINVNGDGYMVLTLPYDDSFKVFIDDNEVKTERTNTAFVGFKISEGYHDVKIIYKSNIVIFSKIISLLGISSFIIYLIALLKNKNKFVKIK